jgi:polyhydroxyalkanoate synthesis regulator phasin
VSIDELSERIRALEAAVQRLEAKLDKIAEADKVDVAQIAADLQHAVILAISAHETSPGTPATTRDVDQVSQRIDQLQARLLG